MKKLLSKLFSFKDAKEKNIFVIYILAILFLSIGIGLIIVFSTIGIIDTIDEQEQDDVQESKFIKSSSIEDMLIKKPHISDFILPSIEKLQEDSSTDILREQQIKWTAEQVEKYWIPVEQIAVELLAEQNQENIEKIFDKSE